MFIIRDVSRATRSEKLVEAGRKREREREEKRKEQGRGEEEREREDERPFSRFTGFGKKPGRKEERTRAGKDEGVEKEHADYSLWIELARSGFGH